MQQMIGKILNTYGVSIKRTAEDVTYRGFFQPVTSRSWQKLLRQVTPLGEASTGLYVYIGAVSKELRSGDGLRLGQREYYVRKTELIYDHQGAAYLWALCVRKGG